MSEPLSYPSWKSYSIVLHRDNAKERMLAGLSRCPDLACGCRKLSQAAADSFSRARCGSISTSALDAKVLKRVPETMDGQPPVPDVCGRTLEELPEDAA
jgi:hypothetical protein